MAILPPDTLADLRVGLSVSPSSDLARLGLMDEHVRLALGELARTTLIMGGRLQYCGHLDPSGYTAFLISELKRYGRPDEPLSVLLAWSVHRRLSGREFHSARRDLGLFGSIECLDVHGDRVDFEADRTDDPPAVPDGELAPSLTAMRQTAICETDGRVLIGGRRTGYQGAMPGVLEEAILAVKTGQPVFLAGGFGGVTHDVVRAVHASAATWLPDEDDERTDEGLLRGLRLLDEIVSDRGWNALANGLDGEENTRLAATHRPSEIAALVSLGLGRLARRTSS